MYRTYWQNKGAMQDLAGELYEKHVMQVLEEQGWTVEDYGENGIYDRGIDIIAHKDGVYRYIQCKDKSPHKFIYENVVAQLYGSVAMYIGPDNLDHVEIYIYTPAQLGPYAKAGAERLNVKVERITAEPLQQKPRRFRYFRKRHYRRYRDD
jgi:hypothetical protein